MIDIKLIRENRDLVKENIKKKFQDEKLPLVDTVYSYDEEVRKLKQEGDLLRKERKDKSEQIGILMRDKKINEANRLKEEVSQINELIKEKEDMESELNQK